MQNSTTPNSRRRRGRVWLTAQFAAPLEVPGIRKVFSLRRMNSAQRPSSKYFLFSDRLPSYLYVIIGVTIFCKLTILEKDADYENQ